MSTLVPHLHTRPSPADVRLHAEERPHQRLDLLAWACLALGVASFLLAAGGGHVLGVVLGVVGFFASMLAQMLSATTSERWLILPGWTLAFVGAALNLFYM